MLASLTAPQDARASKRLATLEARIAAVVADRLGVDPDGLEPEASLADDLAVDSLEIMDVALALEVEFDVVLDVAEVQHVRTYGDLVNAARATVEAHSPDAGVPVRARFVSGVGRAVSAIERVLLLTPYGASLLLDDARSLPSGTRLDVVVPRSTPDGTLVAVRRMLAGVERRGIALEVRREPRAAVPDGRVA
jgi:acyl carrier protein